MDKVGFSPLRFAHSKETVQQLSTAAGRLWRAVTRPPTVGVREARAAVSGRRCCAPCERQRVSLGRTRVCLTATPRRAEGGGHRGDELFSVAVRLQQAVSAAVSRLSSAHPAQDRRV